MAYWRYIQCKNAGVSAHFSMKYFVIILLLTTTTSWTQTVLTGKVSICKECRGLNLSTENKKTGVTTYTVKTSKSKKGKVQTEIIYAPYKIIQDAKEIVSGTTNSKGEFQINDLKFGTYQIQIVYNRLLKADTLIQLNRKRTKIEIELDDRYYLNYFDSVNIAKHPFNEDIAKRDIENGEVKVLTAGLQFLTSNQLDSVTIKYGFKYYPVAGCLVDYYLTKAMEKYNKVVYDYLDKVNGQGWSDRISMDIKALYKDLRMKNER